MTESQVLALLGPAGGGATNTGTMHGNPYHIKSLAWRRETSPDVSINVTVTLNNGKVSRKNWIQIGPKKP
jgi:hypothetical protein